MTFRQVYRTLMQQYSYDPSSKKWLTYELHNGDIQFRITEMNSENGVKLPRYITKRAKVVYDYISQVARDCDKDETFFKDSPKMHTCVTIDVNQSIRTLLSRIRNIDNYRYVFSPTRGTFRVVTNKKTYDPFNVLYSVNLSSSRFLEWVNFIVKNCKRYGVDYVNVPSIDDLFDVDIVTQNCLRILEERNSTDVHYITYDESHGFNVDGPIKTKTIVFVLSYNRFDWDTQIYSFIHAAAFYDNFMVRENVETSRVCIIKKVVHLKNIRFVKGLLTNSGTSHNYARGQGLVKCRWKLKEDNKTRQIVKIDDKTKVKQYMMEFYTQFYVGCNYAIVGIPSRDYLLNALGSSALVHILDRRRKFLKPKVYLLYENPGCSK